MTSTCGILVSFKPGHHKVVGSTIGGNSAADKEA